MIGRATRAKCSSGFLMLSIQMSMYDCLAHMYARISNLNHKKKSNTNTNIQMNIFFIVSYIVHIKTKWISYKYDQKKTKKREKSTSGP